MWQREASSVVRLGNVKFRQGTDAALLMSMACVPDDLKPQGLNLISNQAVIPRLDGGSGAAVMLILEGISRRNAPPVAELNSEPDECCVGDAQSTTQKR